ncbi:MAG: hypothetical protein JXQ66_07550 [Campylobacterales bacterium]|nr:hypothetical protein [Campylobacterales bacterium]
MKKLKKSLICCLVLNSLNLQAIDLANGWNLVSVGSDINVLDIKDQNIKSIWSYGDPKWSAYSFDANYLQTIKDNGINVLDEINSSKGIWIQTTDSFNLTTPPKVSTHDIDIKKGWNLIGTIEDKTSLNSIEADAIYWKYKDQNWTLGENKLYEWSDRFFTISSGEGVWVYASKESIYKEDKQKKFLFLDEKLIPQKVSFADKESMVSGFIHKDVDNFDFNNSGFIPFSASFEGDQLVSEYASSSEQNYVLFLEDATNQVKFENNSTDYMKVPYFSLPSYFLNFEEIKEIAIEAKPIKPILISPNVIMILSNVNLKQSLTLSFEDITAPDELNEKGVFIRGVSTTVKNSSTEIIDTKTIDGQMNLKPIFKNIQTEPKNPYIYALVDDEWRLVGEGIYKNGSVISKNWYNKFASYALVDVDETNIYKFASKILNENAQEIRDAIVVSDNKIVTSTSYDGNFTYISPEKPQIVVAYKDGYKPLILDTSAKSHTLNKLEDAASIDGLNSRFDENFNLIYTIGDKNKEFIYLGDHYSLRPKLLANSDYIIYSSVYDYKDGYVFGASNSIVAYLDKEKNITKLREGDGIIYDGFVANDDYIYFGTFSDSFGRCDLYGCDVDAELSSYNFSDDLLSVVYKPIITSSKIYIPLYDKTNSEDGSLFIKGLDVESNLNLISGIGFSGKLSQNDNEVFFGTSTSKVVWVDKSTNDYKSIDFQGVGIIAKVVELDGSRYAIDLNGLLKNIDTNGSIQLNPSSNLLVRDDELIVASHDGTIYFLDSSLNLKNSFNLDGIIIAEPIIYNDDIYTITDNGNFYKNDTLIGSFNAKVSNINLSNNSLIFGADNGTLWKIDL